MEGELVTIDMLKDAFEDKFGRANCIVSRAEAYRRGKGREEI